MDPSIIPVMGSHTMRQIVSFAVVAAAAMPIAGLAQQPALSEPKNVGRVEGTASQLVNLRHASGQAVAPVYEGFDINADGSFNMWFGYMNRNYEESIDLPIGASNSFDPGGDRGQPTHFTPRRHKDVFKVTVPKDFGEQKLVWKLSAHGQTQQVVGTLKPVWQIDRLRTTRGGNSENISSNLPPAVTVRASDSSPTAPAAATTLTLN